MSSHRPAGAGAPSVRIEPGAHAPAGQDCPLRVHVRNLADGPRELTLTVLGLDGEWVPLPVRTAAVPADATVTVEIPVPLGRGAVPGSYPFALAVEAQTVGAQAVGAQAVGATAAQATTMAEGEIRVDAPSVVMLSIEPAEATAVLGRRVQVVLSNSGDRTVPLNLAVQTPKGMRVTLDDEVVRVPAHTTVRVAARLSVLRPQLVGSRNRRSYSVLAHGEQAPARGQGVLTTRPMFGAGSIRALAMVLVVAVWVTGVVVALPWLSDRFSQGEVVAGPSQAPGDGADGADPAAGGDGGEGADGSGGDGVGDDGAAGADEPAEGVRIGGLVTGVDPAGVRVQVAPATVLDTVQAASNPLGGSGEATASGDAVVTSATASGDAVITTAGLVTGNGRAGGDGFAAGARIVTAPDGDPLGKTPAQALTLTRTETVAAARSTSTEADGTWAFAGMAATANYLITLSKPGFQTQRFVMTGAEAAAVPLKVEMVAGAGRMTGRITGPAGPVGGATLTITDGTTTVSTSTSTTGDVGSWSVDGLSTPSTYLVTAAGEGLGAQSALVQLDAGDSREVDLQLQTGVASLAGTVTGPDSLGAVTGLGGITVTATDGTTTRVASTATAGQAGTFVLADLPVPATYAVTVSGEGYGSQTHEVTLTAGSSAARLDVLLDVSSGVVQGTVTEPGGTGLSGAGLTLTDGENTYKTMSTSDGAGSFRFNGIAPGDYVLTGELFGHVNAYAPVTVAAGGTETADLVLTVIEGDGLLATSRIRGRASDARTNGQLTCPGLDPGDPCTMTATMTAQAADGSTRNLSVTTNPDLEYTIPAPGEPGLLPGLYTVTISAPGYESGEVKVQVPMDQTVVASQVALYPSPSVVGTILARAGSVPAGTCVVAMRDGLDPSTVGPCVIGGDPVTPTCTVTGDARCAAIGLNGSYELQRLSSGTYQVWVVPGDDEYLEVPAVGVSLAPGDIRRYDATLDRLGRVSFTVLTDTGTSSLLPAPQATVTPVRVYSPDTEVAGTAVTTDDDGRVDVTHLQPGTYRFDATWQLTTTSPAVDLQGSSQLMTVGNNQELSNQVVLTRLQNGFASRVVANLGAGGAAGAANAVVRLTGVTGYSGLVPVWSSVTVTTDTTGHFEVVPTLAEDDQTWKVYLPLAGDTVDVSINDTRYEPFSKNGLKIADLDGTAITLEPMGQVFVGKIAFPGEETATTPVDRSKVEFNLEQAPPGADGATVSIGTGDVLVWNDATQPSVGADPAAGTLIRPGTYRVTASVVGYDPSTETFTVPVGASNPLVTFTLSRFGQLRIEVTTVGTGAAVDDPVVTLIRPGQGNLTTAAVPGTNSVDFGSMGSGTYQVRVQAAGHEFTTFDVPLGAGDTAPVVLAVNRLGTIHGNVTVLSGNGTRKALANVLVQALDPTTGRKFTAVTDASGDYRITGSTTVQGLGPATWQVTTSVDGYDTWYAETGGLGATFFAVAIAGSADAAQHITLNPQPVDLTVDLYDPATQDPINGLTVLLHTPTGTKNPTCTPASSTAPPCDVGVDGDGNPLPRPAGRYTFQDIEPGTYTLDVTGGNFAPLMVNVTVAAGAPTQVNIPIAARSNTIMGTVSGQAGALPAQPLINASVELWASPAGAAALQTADMSGGSAFSFAGIPDGTYELRVDHADFTATTRSLSVQGGQMVSVDIVLFTAARQVTVTVTSAQGFDLTGVLVALEPDDAGQLSLAAQPAVRNGPGTYVTTFNQVPPGAWTASVSGPAGHYGTFTAALADGDDAVTVAVDEVRVRLAATTTDATPPSTLDVTVTPSAPGATALLTEPVGVNGGATVVYLARGEYTIDQSDPTGWSSSPASGFSVATSVTDVTATFVLTKDKIATTTTFSTTPPATILQGGALTLSAKVTPASGNVSGLNGATVTFRSDGTSIGTGAVSAGVASSGPLDTSTWTLGDHVLTAELAETSTHIGSVTADRTLTVEATTTTTISADVVAPAAGATVTFTVATTSTAAAGAPAIAGTVQVYEEVGGADTAVGSPVAPGGTVTWTAVTGAHSFYAVFTPTTGTYYRSSTSTPVTVTVT